MCGIVGIYLKTKKYEKYLGKFLSGMLDGMESKLALRDESEEGGVQMTLDVSEDE